MGRKRIKDRASRRRARRGAPPIMIEPLEERLLLSGDLPVVTSFLADNRGLVELGVSADLNASTVNSQTVKIFTAGADGLLGTADDKFVSSNVSYDAVNKIIRADADVAADERYRVTVDGDQITSLGGTKLDAEFNGSDKDTGDGVAGGKLEFFTRSGATTIVRFTTIAGVIDVEMLVDDAPLTVQNFADYMNSGVWDNTFFHRSVDNFVVQGGGFTANSSFSPIPQNDPVRNEPGVSNTRGTIAMAKLGNDPNSATNQWFFNLGDNSENLDSQNGGFTVFARVTDAASLAVMDALAAYDTVNASAQNPAFSDIPVKDTQVVEDRMGVIAPSDLIRVTRIARLYDVSSEAFSQLPTGGLQTIASSGGGSVVTIFSLNGVSLGNASDFLKVNFSGDKQISSIQFTGKVPAPIGIQISGASVGSVIDKGGAGDNVRFIVSDQSIGKISIKGSVVGTNLNGVLLSNGVLMPDDIDGDTDGGDNAAIVVRDGSINSLNVGGDVRGSITVSDGILAMNVKGQMRDADMVLGTPTDFASSTNFKFGSARDTSLETMVPIRTLKTGEWVGSGRITAPAIATLNVGGGRDVSGDIEVDLNLTGSPTDSRTLGRAVIQGIAVRSVWNIEGDAGIITIRDGLGNWNLNVSGDTVGLSTGPVTTSSVDVGGILTRLSASEWLGGEINAGGLSNMQINGGRAYSGDFFADMDIAASQMSSSLSIAGDVRDGEIIMRGDVRNFRLGGDIEDSNLDFAALKTIKLHVIRDSTLRFRSDLKAFSANQWDGGGFTGNSVDNFAITAERNGADGSFNGTFRANRIDLLTVAGDFQSTDAELRIAGRFNVAGDINDSRIAFVQNDVFNPAVQHVYVGGTVSNSDMLIEGTAGSVSVGAMFDSQLAMGTFSQLTFGFPTSGSSFNSFFRTDTVTVRGLAPGQVSMSNSYILGANIGEVRIMNPDLGSLSMPYGVAALSLDRVEMVFTDGTAMGLGSPTSSTAISSYEVRPNFVPASTTT